MSAYGAFSSDINIDRLNKDSKKKTSTKKNTSTSKSNQAELKLLKTYTWHPQTMKKVGTKFKLATDNTAFNQKIYSFNRPTTVTNIGRSNLKIEAYTKQEGFKLVIRRN